MAESVLDLVQQLKSEIKPVAEVVVTRQPDCTVFEVPTLLREKYPDNFPTVKGLELGLHHRSLKKTETEVFKFEIACILHFKLATSRNSSWESFAQLVVKDVNRARRAYSATSSSTSSSGPCMFTDNEVQNLLTLDALFLVVFFMYINGKSFILEVFRALEARLEHMVNAIDYGDFLLVENQVPMYLLQSVIRHLCKIDEEIGLKVDPTFDVESKVTEELDLILNIAILHLYPFKYPDDTGNVSSHGSWLPRRFSRCSSRQVPQTSRNRLQAHLFATYPLDPLENSLINCRHLLDCLYTVICGHLLPLKLEPNIQTHAPLESIPSTTRLQAIGIRATASPVPTLSDIKLNRPTRGFPTSSTIMLQLPKVVLYDYTESAFHNLALHEQLVFGGRCGDMRCYLQCMASLSINEADLQILTEEGVINDHTGTQSLQGMWARTLKGVYTANPSTSWIKCYQEIHRRRKSCSRRHDCGTRFFANPWILMCVLAATLLLFLSATQTWFVAFPRH
jgi:hypothetical protein